MEFKVTMTSISSNNLEEVKLYEKIGFVFVKHEHVYYYANNDIEPIITLNTIEELVQLTKDYGQIIVNGNEIEIYNDIREY